MKQIIYKENYAAQSFPGLIKEFGEEVTRDEIRFDPSKGEGNIRVTDIEPGLQLRIWDCILSEEIVISREPDLQKDKRSYTLIYYLTPETFILEDCQNTATVISSLWNTVLISSDAKFCVKLLPGMPLKCVSINFSPDWVEKNILCDTCLGNHLQLLFELTNDPFAIFESFSEEERKEIEAMVNENRSQRKSVFFIKSRILNLFTEFFSKLARRLSLLHDEDQQHNAQMASVEKELMENIYHGLPNLKILARKICVSESTLKRYFRRAYGKNIYNYFLEKRMACASKLLTEKGKSVTSTAYLMGYDNVSKFSEMFKKFYGELPSTFREKKLLSQS